MNEALDFEAACRIARAERQSVAVIRRVLSGEAAGVLTDEQRARIVARAREALQRLAPSKRVRLVEGVTP